MSERGRDYFIMFLARELRMTRRQLLDSIDSYEISMWAAFFKAENKPPDKKDDPEKLKHNLMTAFGIHKAKTKKRK